jgi:hypothetical protein
LCQNKCYGYKVVKQSLIKIGEKFYVSIRVALQKNPDRSKESINEDIYFEITDCFRKNYEQRTGRNLVELPDDLMS